MNNKRAKKAYYNKDILHNVYSQSGDTASREGLGKIRCRNFQNSAGVLGNSSVDGFVINPESDISGDERSRKKPRFDRSDNMQIIYKVRTVIMM